MARQRLSEEALEIRRAYYRNWKKKRKAEETPEQREYRLAKNREYQQRYWERRAEREQAQEDSAMQIAEYIEKEDENEMKMTVSRHVVDGLLDLISNMTVNYQGEDELRELIEELREKLYRENGIEIEIDTMA